MVRMLIFSTYEKGLATCNFTTLPLVTTSFYEWLFEPIDALDTRRQHVWRHMGVCILMQNTADALGAFEPSQVSRQLQ